jgi:hypothetical protein
MQIAMVQSTASGGVLQHCSRRKYSEEDLDWLHDMAHSEQLLEYSL